MEKYMEIKKNDIVVVTIDDIGMDGEGIGKVDGYTLFIKDAIIGDKIEAKVMKTKKNYGYARLMNIVEPSPYRVEPKCSLARPCGGCQIQSMSYERQLVFKQEKVKNNLLRIGGFLEEEIPMQKIIGMDNPWRYRNKAQVPVGRDKDGNLATGFYAGRTHDIINQEDCYIGSKKNQEILNKVKQFMDTYGIPPYYESSHMGLIRHILIREGFVTGQIMVCLIINGDKLPESDKLVSSLLEVEGMTSISLNINKEKTNVILGKEIINLYGEGYIYDYIGDVKYQISPLSFFQVNPVQTNVLYETALEYADLKGDEVVWDLYCGIGTISLFLAQKAKMVYGVEIVPAAIEDAKKNAMLNGFNNAKFYVGKAEEVLPQAYEKEHIYADVIVVDPPRKGCDETLLNTIVEMSPKRVVYVSCDSATLARDVRYLADRGYELRKVQPVDMFPHTGHVETVVLLSKKTY